MNVMQANIERLNSLVNTARKLSDHITKHKENILFKARLLRCVQKIRLEFDDFLSDRLFDIYDDYFDDSEMRPIEAYLSSRGVQEVGDEVGESNLFVMLKASPLRIELKSPNGRFRKIGWQHSH